MTSQEDKAQTNVFACNTEAEHYTCSSDFSDEEDDSANELPKSTEYMADPLKSGESTDHFNDNEISDDECKDERVRKVSFLDTQLIVGATKGDHYFGDCSNTEGDFVNEYQIATDNMGYALKAGDSRIGIKEFDLSDDEGANTGSVAKEDHQISSELTGGGDHSDRFKNENSETEKNDADLSEDESIEGTPRKVLFVKSPKICSYSKEESCMSDVCESDDNSVESISGGRTKKFELSDDEATKSDYCSHSDDTDEDSMKEFHQTSTNNNNDASKGGNSRAGIEMFELPDDEAGRTDFLQEPKRISDPAEESRTHPQPCSDNMPEGEGDSVTKPYKSRKNAADALEIEKSDVELSDDDRNDGTPKKLSSRKITSKGTKGDDYSCSSDLSEAEGDLVNVLCKSTESRADAFKARESKIKMNDFHISDEEGTEKDSGDICSPTEAEHDSISDEDEDQSLEEFLKSPQNEAKMKDFEFSDNESTKTDPHINNLVSARESNTNKVHLSIQIAIDDIELPEKEGVKKYSILNSCKINHLSGADQHSLSDKNELPTSAKIPPDAKYDQKTNKTLRHDFQKVSLRDKATANAPLDSKQDHLLEEAVTQASSKHCTLWASSPFSNDTSRTTAARSCNPKYPTSFEELDNVSGDHSDHCRGQVSHNLAKSANNGTLGSPLRINQITTTHKSNHQKVRYREVKSKYMGTLTLLDQKVSLEECEPLTANLLRAAYYHRWLTKKNKKSKANMLTIKEEEEKTKQEEEAKKEAAIMSFEAWEKKKISLKAEAKEKLHSMRREQQASSKQQDSEKRQSAKKAFEKWKQQRDRLLKEKHRQEKEAENALKFKVLQDNLEKRHSAVRAFEKWKQDHDQLLKERSQREKEAKSSLRLKKESECLERTRKSETVFRNWCEKKQSTTERKDVQTRKAGERRSRDEERDRMALQAYEDWLTRKDLKQKGEREGRLKTVSHLRLTPLKGEFGTSSTYTAVDNGHGIPTVGEKHELLVDHRSSCPTV